MRSTRQTGPFFVTTSWDDGHPSDRRLADLLAKHKIHGTFYVPCRNSEGRPVMRDAEVRDLAHSFEIDRAVDDRRITSTVRLFNGDDTLCSATVKAVVGDRTRLPYVAPRVERR